MAYIYGQDPTLNYAYSNAPASYYTAQTAGPSVVSRPPQATTLFPQPQAQRSIKPIVDYSPLSKLCTGFLEFTFAYKSSQERTSLQSFIKRIFTEAEPPEPETTAIYALYLLLRLRYAQNGLFTEAAQGLRQAPSRHRLFLAALLLAHKVLDDVPKKNTQFSAAARSLYDLTQINQMEREICDALTWDFTVAPEQLEELRARVFRHFGEGRNGPSDRKIYALPLAISYSPSLRTGSASAAAVASGSLERRRRPSNAGQRVGSSKTRAEPVPYHSIPQPTVRPLVRRTATSVPRRGTTVGGNMYGAYVPR